MVFADNRISINKELPTTKWRRDHSKSIRLSTEYHNQDNVIGTVKPLGESNQTNNSSSSSTSDMEIPLDMTLGNGGQTSLTKIPPPPYREPLPSSTFSPMSRPSVITQAPKREANSANQENKESLKKTATSHEENCSAAGELLIAYDIWTKIFFVIKY